MVITCFTTLFIYCGTQIYNVLLEKHNKLRRPNFLNRALKSKRFQSVSYIYINSIHPFLTFLLQNFMKNFSKMYKLLIAILLL